MPPLPIDDRPGVENAIYQYIQCETCHQEDREFNLAAGITVDGDLQFWCDNHDINIALMELPWSVEPPEHEGVGDAR